MQWLLSLLALCLLPVESLKFKVVTYNIANYDDHGNWSTRAQMLADVLVKVDADLVAMQEPRFDPKEESTRILYQNQAEEILYLMTTKGFYRQPWLGRHPRKVSKTWQKDSSLVTQPTMFYPPNADSFPLKSDADQGVWWEGSSIFSKRRLIETGTRFLTKSDACSDLNLRATQYVAVDISSPPEQFTHGVPPHSEKEIVFHLFNAHFGLDGVCLSDNVDETLAYMKPYLQYPSLMVGDLNATPDNPLLQRLAENGYVDLWTKVWPTHPGYTFPAEKPAKRLDYGWANKVLADSIHSIKILGAHPNAHNIYASDHLGLLFEFDL